MEKEVMIEKTFSLHKLLNPIRLRYPWYFGAALWLAWILSITIGGSRGRNTDRFGQLIGTDYAAFYSAGEIIRSGQSPQLYDAALAIEIQTRIYGYEPQNFNPYLNPPFYAWLFVPLSMLPYPASPVVWMIFNLICLFLGIKALGIFKPYKNFLLALTWIPAWSAISFGQNSFLSVLIFSLSFYFYRGQKKFLAGMILGLLSYKPQLLFGVLLFWILDYKQSWKSLLGCFLTGILLVSSSYIFLPEATVAYFTYAQKISSSLMSHPAFPMWNAHGTLTFWLGIFPAWPKLASILYLVTAGFGLFVFLRFIFSKNYTGVTKFSAAILFTAWATPYLMIYDWAILLVPAILLWQEYNEVQKEWTVTFATLWIVMLISGPLSAILWKWLGWTVQISLPTLAFTLYLSHHIVRAHANRKIGKLRKTDLVSAL